MAIDMFMTLGDIKGESQDKTHKEDIEVLAWSWGMSQSGTMHMGTGGGAGKVSVQDLSFTKYSDKASPPIMAACTKGTHIDKALLTVRKAGGDNPLEYYKITLEGVLDQFVFDGRVRWRRALYRERDTQLQKFHVEYQPQNAKGAKEGGVVEVKWNIPANAPT